MSIQPLQTAMSAARKTLEGVQADQLQNQTPCESWDVAALINHMVGGQKFFADGMNGEPPSADETDFASGDYLASFDETAAACISAFSAEGAMEKTVTLPFGEFPGAGFMGLAMTDIFTHAWDLAKATGQSTDLAPELASVLLTRSQQSIEEAFRGPEGAPFGAEQVAPEGANPADRLAAFLGRQV